MPVFYRKNDYQRKAFNRTFTNEKQRNMAKNIDVSYGKKLKLLRINQFKTQKDMAIKFKISQQSYSDMEKGKTRFTETKIKKVCKFFRISFADFVILENKQRKINEKKKDSYAIRVLKQHYEVKILEKQVRIGELELENSRLKRIKSILEKKIV